MIAGLCECPLTFQTIVIWRDGLSDGRILLRDIIDLRHSMPASAKQIRPTIAPGAESAHLRVAPKRAPHATSGSWKQGLSAKAISMTMNSNR